MRILWAFLLLLSFAGPATAADGARVYAASSLTEAMTAIAAAYAAAGHPRPVLVFGGTSTLARQVEHGAPGGVFVAADAEWPAYLARNGLEVAGSRAIIARNALVLIVPAGRPRTARLVPGFDLVRFIGARGRWTTGDPAGVPVGRYAKAALIRLGAWQRAAPRLARAENVRAALAFVERGAAEAGVVYATDALASRKVAVAGRFPDSSHAPIVYPALLTRGAGAEARAFHAYLSSPAARALLARRGFTLP